MKLSYWLSAAVMAALLALAGCSKPAKPEFKTQGVVIDMQKLYGLSHGTSPDVQNAVRQAQMNIQYSRFTDALASLDKVANDPSLNDAQKKDAADLIAQVKELASKPPAQ